MRGEDRTGGEEALLAPGMAREALWGAKGLRVRGQCRERQGALRCAGSLCMPQGSWAEQMASIPASAKSVTRGG